MFESALYFPDLFVKLYFIDKTQILLRRARNSNSKGLWVFLTQMIGIRKKTVVHRALTIAHCVFSRAFQAPYAFRGGLSDCQCKVLCCTLHCATNSSQVLRFNASFPPLLKQSSECLCTCLTPCLPLFNQVVGRWEACVSLKNQPAPERRRTFTLTKSCMTLLSW